MASSLNDGIVEDRSGDDDHVIEMNCKAHSRSFVAIESASVIRFDWSEWIDSGVWFSELNTMVSAERGIENFVEEHGAFSSIFKASGDRFGGIFGQHCCRQSWGRGCSRAD